MEATLKRPQPARGRQCEGLHGAQARGAGSVWFGEGPRASPAGLAPSQCLGRVGPVLPLSQSWPIQSPFGLSGQSQWWAQREGLSCHALLTPCFGFCLF